MLKVLGVALRLELIILLAILYMVTFMFTVGSCCKVTPYEAMSMMRHEYKKRKDNKEGFTEYGTTDGSSGDGWIENAQNYASSMKYQDHTKKSDNYIGTPMPMESGSMDFFKNNKFSADCCPSTYTTDAGCACLSTDQVNYLNARGGNRTGDSEY